MKKCAYWVMLLFLCLPASASGGHGSPTGDADWDGVVAQLNAFAGSGSPQVFRDIDERYRVQAGTAERLVRQNGFSAGDACIALKLSHLTGRPLDEVVSAHKAGQGGGWGAVAKGFGIKPGSKEFHQLKNDTRSFLDEEKGSSGKGHNEASSAVKKGKSNSQKKNNGKGKGKGNGKGTN